MLGLVAMLRSDFPLIVGIPLYIGMILAANGDLYCDNEVQDIIL